MTPHRGNTILFRSSQQLPRLRLGPLKGFLSSHGTLQGSETETKELLGGTTENSVLRIENSVSMRGH